ncbi:hypothetical protein [Streptosporangium saharense]|uniref:hypothetical protein n=1 Tax=Streptosporangium saharense TaxID=1706840 RepID=UPI0034205E07
MSIDPAVAWLEEQADAYAALPDTVTEPPAPAHLAYPGAEQLPSRTPAVIAQAQGLRA